MVCEGRHVGTRSMLLPVVQGQQGFKFQSLVRMSDAGPRRVLERGVEGFILLEFSHLTTQENDRPFQDLKDLGWFVSRN